MQVNSMLLMNHESDFFVVMIRLILSSLEVVKELDIVQDLHNISVQSVLILWNCPFSEFILNILEPDSVSFSKQNWGLNLYPAKV